MKWRAACCVILLVCLMLPTGRVMAATGATVVTGSVPLVSYEVCTPHVGFSIAIISWKTNGAATSQVFYDIVSRDSIADYAYYTRQRNALVEKRNMTLNKLSSATIYYYRVRSTAGGVESVSDEYTFTTLPSRRGWKGWLISLFVEFTFPLYFWWSR